MYKSKMTIGLALCAGLLVGCSGGESTPEPTPEQTLAVKPVRDLTSPAISSSDSAPEDSQVFEGEWFSLSLPSNAEVAMENEELTGPGGSTYVWTVDGYDVQLQKATVESSKIPDYPGTDLAEDHALYYLTLMDGTEVDQKELQAGPLKGWALNGYYVSHSVEDEERTVRYFFSNDQSLVTFTYAVPFEKELPHDFMNTLVLKEGTL